MYLSLHSCLQNTYHLGDSYTLQDQLPESETTLATSGAYLLSDAGLFLVPTNFLAPADHH